MAGPSTSSSLPRPPPRCVKGVGENWFFVPPFAVRPLQVWLSWAQGGTPIEYVAQHHGTLVATEEGFEWAWTLADDRATVTVYLFYDREIHLFDLVAELTVIGSDKIELLWEELQPITGSTFVLPLQTAELTEPPGNVEIRVLQ